MSNKDTVSHDYMSEPEIFADAYNFFAYGGEKVIEPNNLEPEDVAEEIIINRFKSNITIFQ